MGVCEWLVRSMVVSVGEKHCSAVVNYSKLPELQYMTRSEISTAQTVRIEVFLGLCAGSSCTPRLRQGRGPTYQRKEASGKEVGGS